MHDEKGIKEAVRQRYATSAATESTCRGPRGDSKGTGRTCGVGYSPEEIASLDPEVASIGLGCGNPTRLAELGPGEIVLDLGSGGGIDVFLAARLVGPTGKAIGVDMTEEMLERARRAAAAMGISNVEFRHGDIEALPLPDESVDAVISNCVINLAPDKSRVFQEAIRVLKPRGRMLISDVVSDGALPASLRTDPDTWTRCVGGAMDEGAYLGLIRAAGFQEVEVLTRQGQVASGEVYSISVRARKAIPRRSSEHEGTHNLVTAPLDSRTEELIAIGAALASHCEPCLRYHIRRATEVGCTIQEMRRAVEIAQNVKATPARLLTNLAARLLGSSSAKPGRECPGDAPATEKTEVRSGSCCSSATLTVKEHDGGSQVGDRTLAALGKDGQVG